MANFTISYLKILEAQIFFDRESVARVIHQQSSTAQFVTTTFRAELLKDADRHFGVYYRGKASQVITLS